MSFQTSEEPVFSLATAITLVDEIKRLEAELREQQARIDDLKKPPVTDLLVRLPDRRGFQEALVRAISRFERYGEPGAIVLLAVEDFSNLTCEVSIKDWHAAIMSLAALLQAKTRMSDLVAHLTDWQFGILMPHTDASCARVLATRISDALACPDLRCLRVATGVARIKRFDTAEKAIFRAEQSLGDCYSAAKGARMT
jgi:PleD family two-component response regulator